MVITYISMLRGINVSGQKKIPMPQLKQLYESLGFENVQTYVQSGNVIFSGDAAEESRLGQLIEAGIEQAFGYVVPVFIRQPQDFKRIIEDNPFLTGNRVDPAFLHITFLYEAPQVIKLTEMHSHITDGDEFAPGVREIFLYCPAGYGRTKYSNGYFERQLKVAATTRNWKTVGALYELVRVDAARRNDQ